jgi:hypothetical protein
MFIALIAAGGTFGLIGLVVLIAVLMDILKRNKKNGAGSTDEEEEKSTPVDVSEAEKGHSKPTTPEASAKSPISRQSSHVYSNYTRPESPECSCEHPSFTVPPFVSNPPRI